MPRGRLGSVGGVSYGHRRRRPLGVLFSGRPSRLARRSLPMTRTHLQGSSGGRYMPLREGPRMAWRGAIHAPPQRRYMPLWGPQRRYMPLRLLLRRLQGMRQQGWCRPSRRCRPAAEGGRSLRPRQFCRQLQELPQRSLHHPPPRLVRTRSGSSTSTIVTTARCERGLRRRRSIWAARSRSS